MHPEKFDVYAYGVIASSTLYLLEGDFPAQSGYAEFIKKLKNIGGEAANSAFVLARLGLKVKLDGNWINPDEDADFIKNIFKENQVDITRVSFQKCTGPKEMLIVDTNARTIFGTYGHLSQEKSWNLPKESDIANASVICLDPFFEGASLQAVEYATKHKKPIVTVDCEFDDPIFRAADVVIISEEFLRDAYPTQDINKITLIYQKNTKGSVILTFGSKEILYGSQNEGWQQFTPYQIDPIDTTGAGDSFRAGIIYGLVQKWQMARTVAFASALAALVCQSYPGVLSAPRVEQVISFMEEHNQALSG
jgi:sugar/nucleoside kinase (ribokinase family)